jgi:hypothetical protein
MPRLRRSIQKINNLQTAPIDYDEQEELIELLKLDNMNTNNLFINIFTVFYLIPIPFFIHLKHYRRIPVDSFLSIVTQICSIIAIRYLLLIRLEGPLKHMTNRWVFATFMNSIALYLFIKHFDLGNTGDLLFLAPLISSVSSSLLQYWISSMDYSIEGLNSLKYKYKSA